MEKTPLELGYRMPPEWAKHSGTELHWPQNTETWPQERMENVQEVYFKLIQALSTSDHVHLFVDSQELEQEVKLAFEKRQLPIEGITFHCQPTNDVWARDCGPIFVQNDKGESAVVNWGFNSWGEKYPPFDADNALPAYVAKTYRLPSFEPEMILEGGSIDVNGAGVVLTTESVLLNPNRNPDLSKEEIEDRLRNFLGIEKIIWLKDGLEGDDTDGHIDDLARFVNETTIVCMVSEDPLDVNYEALRENRRRLEEARDSDGNPFTIVELPMPMTQIEEETVDGSSYVPASYANFYIANSAVLLPLYDERYDHKVIDIFNSLFPEKSIIGIPCKDLVWGQGSIHCITQQWYL